MTWNWQQKDWPNFTYDKAQLEGFESQFLKGEGMLIGAFEHLKEEDKNNLIIDMISDEALKTSEIEGEYLNRDSVQSSIRRQFGFQTDQRRSSPSEQGIAEMMVDLYQTFAEPLTHVKLFEWHKMVMRGRHDLTDMGRYRTHEEPMQVVSGPIGHPRIHFETPPSSRMKEEMERFITWFNETSPSRGHSLPALTRGGISHLHFICIHPFEDGNGRIGRAVTEKALAQSFGQPTLLALAQTIEKHKKAYYNVLEKSNKSNEITDWLVYFCKTALEAQEYTHTCIRFLIEKTKTYDRVRGNLNTRQEKVLARMFRAGPAGFKGGLSAKNYISLTKASRATATRDLNELVSLKVLTKTGELRHTRYHLSFDI